MEIFWRLAFAHLLADFTFQTNEIAEWKRRDIWGLVVHVGLHLVFSVMLVWPYMNKLWIDLPWIQLNGWSCILLQHILHFVEDEWRIWSVSKRGAPDNTIFYLWDQVIHFVVIFSIAPIVDGFIGTKWPILGSILVIITHFTTVTIYFVEKDVLRGTFPLDREKDLFMIERMFIAGCVILLGWWSVIVILAWGAFIVWGKTARKVKRSWVNISMGNLIAILCGVFAHLIVYHA